jgi:protoporphyrinogen oxidase
MKHGAAHAPGVIRAGETVAIVGGGALGLTVAWHLARAGVAVTVFEAAPELGGLASSWSVPTDDEAVNWDRFYHVILESDQDVRALLAGIGLDAELRWTHTRTGYWAGGRLSPVSTPRDFLTLPGLSLVAKARLAATLARGTTVRNWQALERMPVADWLTRWSGRTTFEQFWVPLLEAKLGEGWRDANAAFIWATIRRLTAARRAGIGDERFGAIPGGVGRVLSSLAATLTDLGVAIRVGVPIDRVCPTGDGAVELVLGTERLRFDHAVVTTTPRAAAAMLPDLAAGTRRAWDAIRYQGVVCASFVLRRPLGPYYLTYLMDRLPFTAVVEMTTLVPPEWFGGRSLVYLPRYVARDDPCFDRSDADIEAEFLDGLRRVHPVADSDVVGSRVARAREVFPLPVLSFSERVPPIATGVPGVHLVSSAQIVNGTLNLNETVGLGGRSAATLLGAGRP